MGSRTVKNYPSPRLVETIGATNQKPAEAIGELVANCFDARVEGTNLEIIVDLRSNKVVVTDNGKGMDGTTLEHAVCIGEDMSRYIDRGEGAKGHFGMGFKTSCSTLGGYYEIYTRPVRSDLEYHVAFDISEYSRRPSGADAWDVVIEDKPVTNDGPLGDAPHGTSFVISRLKVKDTPVQAVLEYLGEAFKGHLNGGDEIKILDDISGELYAKPKRYSFKPGTKIDIDTSFGPDDAYRITGWAAIDTQTHNNGLYGFNIYRRGQLVESYNKDWFKAHLMTSRIIGEVELDFLDATFYKQGLQQDELWKLATAHMRVYLKDLENASKSFSRKGNIDNPVESKKIISQLRASYEMDPYDFGERQGPAKDEEKDPSSSGGAPKTGKTESVNTKIKNVVRERSLAIDGVGEIDITYLEREVGGNTREPFDYIFDEGDDEGDASELQIVVYKKHPLWAKKVDDEVRKVLATSDGIYRMMVEQLSMNPSDALKVRNEWVWSRSNGGAE